MSHPTTPAPLLPFGPRAQLAAALALVLLVRFGLAAASECIHSDGPEYVKVAEWYAAGRYDKALAHPYHPMYPVLLACAHGLLGDWERAGLAVSALLSSLAAIPLFRLARRSFGEAAALPAALLYALHPYVQLSAMVATTGTYLFWVLWTMDLADQARRENDVRATLLAGLCAGGGYLTRPDGLLLFLGTAAVVAHGVRDWRGRAKHAAALGLAGAMVVLPYCAWLWAVTGSWVPTGKMQPVHLWLQELRDTEGVPVFTEHQRRIVDLRTSHPVWHVLSGIGRTAWETLRALHVPGLFLIAGLALAWRGRREEPRPGNWTMLAFPAIFVLALAYFSTVAGRESKRYTVPIAAMTLAWSGAGMARLAARWGAEGGATRRLRWIAGVTVLVLCVWALRVPGSDKAGERIAGLWIREHAPRERPRVLTRMDRVAFYAQGLYLPIFSHEPLDPEKLAARIDAEHPDYLVADYHLEEVFPGFFAWTENAGKERLKLVYQTTKPSSRDDEDQLRVFQVLPR